MAQIKEEYIRRAREVPIQDIWARLGLPDVRAGAALRSPFREDKKPSCQLGGAKNIFFDHATGESLDPIGLVRKVRESSFKEAVAFVLGRPLDELIEQTRRPGRRKGSGGGSPPGSKASDAGLPPDAVEELARVRGWRPEALRALGAESRHAQAPREVHFPMRDAAGKVVGYRRRRSDGKAFSGGSKALSNKGAKNGLLCPWPFPEEDKGEVLVVEGEADACAALSAGSAAVVATPGAQASRACVRDLQELLAKREVILFPDPDEAGRRWLERIGRALVNAGCRVRFVPAETDDLDKRLKLEDRPREALEALVREAVPFIVPSNSDKKSDSLTCGSDSRASPNVPSQPDDHGGESSLPIVYLPGGAENVRISNSAGNLGQLISKEETLFVRGGTVVRVAADDAGGATVAPVGPAALTSQLEKVADLRTTKHTKGGEIREFRKNCTKQHAELIIECEDFLKVLPPLRILTRCPVLTKCEGQLVVVTGYHRPTGTYAAGGAVADVSLDEARNILNEMLDDFQFATPSDRARALAAVITPALVQGGLLGGRAPLDLSEADLSQTGKGYRAKLTAALYNDTPKIITQRERGTGGLEESFSAALIRGATFVSIDNVRGKLGSPALESALTEDYFSARTSYGKPTDIDMRRTVVMMTSNRAELTADLASRCSPVLLRKQPEGYQFKTFEGGRDILEHVRERQGRYLGAVFAVVRTWWEAGRPRTTETRHDFRAWAQTLDWIVQNLLGAAPLCDGLKETKSRMTTPSLNWLRDIAVEVDRAGQTGNWLRTSELLDILDEVGLEIPGLPEGGDVTDEGTRDKANRATGRRLRSCFKQAAEVERDDLSIKVLDVGGTVVERREEYDAKDRYKTKSYRFTPAAIELVAMAAGSGNPCSDEPATGESGGTKGEETATCGHGAAGRAAMDAAMEPPAAAIAAMECEHSTTQRQGSPVAPSEPHRDEPEKSIDPMAAWPQPAAHEESNEAQDSPGSNLNSGQEPSEKRVVFEL